MRSVAIVRVVFYHATELSWLTVAFPAMGVMFALAGSLTARSLIAAEAAAAERASRSTTAVVVSRFRRLLPSVWVFGAVAVIVALGQGYSIDAFRNHGFLWWLVPLATPAYVPSELSWAFTAGLWYVVAYLWFVLLTPALLRLFQSWPRSTLIVALALPVVLHLQILTIGGSFHPHVYDLTQYLACWVIGIAHRVSWLPRVPAPLFWSGVGLLAVVSMGWLAWTGQTLQTADMHQLPVANALWSAAFAAALLRLGSSGRMARLAAQAGSPPLLASAVRVLNARALTIYLWHFPSLVLGQWVAGLDPVMGPRLLVVGVITVAGTALAALAVGWVEDVAARRPVTVPWRVPVGPVVQPTGAGSDADRR